MSRTTSGRRDPEERFWTAYARGANFEDLKRRGFTVFYPSVDDYVFLRAVSENRGLVERADELGLQYFLRVGGELAEVTWADIAGMAAQAVQSIGPGDLIEVVRGPAEGLRGRVIELRADGVRVRVRSWIRWHEVTVAGTDLILVKPDAG